MKEIRTRWTDTLFYCVLLSVLYLCFDAAHARKHARTGQTHYILLLCFAFSYTSEEYGVASISRLLKMIGLFCKRALQKRLYSAKETYTFKEPTNRSQPICAPAIPMCVMCCLVCACFFDELLLSLSLFSEVLSRRLSAFRCVCMRVYESVKRKITLIVKYIRVDMLTQRQALC